MHLKCGEAQGERHLRRVLALTVGFFAIETAGGFIAHSLALISDAGHMLIDVSALALAMTASIQGRRPRDLKRTYGYQRLEFLAALANGGLLILIAAGILREAWLRLHHPAPIRIDLMLAVAAAGLVANLVGLYWLRHDRQSNLNLRAAFYHVAGDTLGSVGAVAAALVIRFTGWTQADAVASVLISILIILGATSLLRESLHYLMEGAPRDIRVSEVETSLREFPGVMEIHDLHLWRISSGLDVLTAHVVVEDIGRWREVQAGLQNRLREQFGLSHATIQMEGKEERDSRTHREGICDDR